MNLLHPNGYRLYLLLAVIASKVDTKGSRCSSAAINYSQKGL